MRMPLPFGSVGVPKADRCTDPSSRSARRGKDVRDFDCGHAWREPEVAELRARLAHHWTTEGRRPLGIRAEVNPSSARRAPNPGKGTATVRRASDRSQSST